MSRRPGRPPGYKPNGPEIYRLRVEVHHLPAAELAAKLGVTPAWIWLAEQGKPVSDVFAHRLANALGVEVEDIATPPEPETMAS